MTYIEQNDGKNKSPPTAVPYKPNWRLWATKWQLSELIGAIPHDAKLSPTADISEDLRGKVPGQKNPDGTWNGRGGSWCKDFSMNLAGAKKADRDGAIVGMQGRIFPGLDLDLENETHAQALQEIAFEIFGPTFVRSREGSARRLLIYQIEDGQVPLKKHRLEIRDEAATK